MTVADREYMQTVTGEFDQFAVGVDAKSQSHAEKILKWACPTRDAFGKWHAVTLALSNVPYHMISNLLSNANFIAQRLRELSGETTFDPEELQRLADRVDSLRYLIYERDRLDDEWKKQFAGLNVHRPLNVPKQDA